MIPKTHARWELTPHLRDWLKLPGVLHHVLYFHDPVHNTVYSWATLQGVDTRDIVEVYLHPEDMGAYSRSIDPPTLPPTDTKDSNPKDIVGSRKVSFSSLPWRVLHGVALALLEGACKYGRHNYRAVGVRASVYFDAVVARHLSAWWEGEDIDQDSGLSHVDKAIAGLMVMRDSMLQGNFVDDRPPKGVPDFPELNRLAGDIQDRHKDKTPQHFTIKDI